MFERVMAAYRQRAQSGAIRTEAKLEVDPLEQRAAPALTAEGIAPPVAPPELVQVGPVASHPNEASVRTDLFGVGEGNEPDDTTWQDWFGPETPAGENDLAEPAPARNESAGDANGRFANETPDSQSAP